MQIIHLFPYLHFEGKLLSCFENMKQGVQKHQEICKVLDFE
jgi:hypothetical protein